MMILASTALHNSVTNVGSGEAMTYRYNPQLTCIENIKLLACVVNEYVISRCL